MCFSLIPRKCCHVVLSFYAGLGGWASEVPCEVLKSIAKRTNIPFVRLELKLEELTSVETSAHPAESFLNLVLNTTAFEVECSDKHLCSRNPLDSFIFHLHASTTTQGTFSQVPAEVPINPVTSQPKSNVDLLICAKVSIIEVWPALKNALLTAGPQDT